MTRKINQNKSQDGIEIIIEKSDKNIKYEKLIFPRMILNYLIVQFITSIPKKFARKIIQKSNNQAAHIKNNVTTHSALDTLYKTGLKFNKKNNIFKEIVEHTWFNFNNPKSVRNRLKLVKKLLNQAIKNKIENHENQLLIFSLASGSARAVIETLKNFKNIEAKVFLIDKNPKALDISKKVIKESELNPKNFRLINEKVRNFDNYNDTPVDIIEMVGLLDYLDEEKSILILKKIYHNLAPGGTLITANIRHNWERKFLDKTLNWKMIYREADDLSKIICKAGFKPEKTKIYFEPLLIHGVVIAQK